MEVGTTRSVTGLGDGYIEVSDTRIDASVVIWATGVARLIVGADHPPGRTVDRGRYHPGRDGQLTRFAPRFQARSH